MAMGLDARLVAALITAVGASTDLRTGHIPNWLTLPTIFFAPIVYGVVDGWRAAIGSIVATVFCGLFPYLMYRSGGIAAGDVKLFAAVGAVSGSSFGFFAQCLSFILVIPAMVIWLLWRGELHVLFRRQFSRVANRFLSNERKLIVPELKSCHMRFGGVIFLGTLWAVLIKNPVLFGG